MMIDKLIDGRYRLLEMLGEGGTSLVFIAEDMETSIKVAIKILSPSLAEKQEYADAFEKEAKVLSRLKHENIIELLTIGGKGKLKYFTTRYIEGVSLEQKLQEFSLSIEEKINIAVKVCNALEYAHSRGIVHKDLKPANILVTKDNTPVIADFGIAEAPIITNGDKKEVFGTVQYFSPEQAKGEKTDRRTDIYSMGIILYELMTGELPFNGEDSVAIALKHLHQIPAAPIQKNSALPESVNRIILKAMRKEKGRRYQTMAEMQKDLSRCLEEPGGEYIAGYEENEKLKAGHWHKKRGSAVFVGVVAVLLILITAFVIMNTLGLFGGKQSSQVYLPSLKDKTVAEAEAVLSSLGLAPEYIYQANGEVEEGRVISQSPDMGSLVNRGDAVALVISQGAKSVKELPSLAGMGEEEALRLLYDTGFMDISINYVNQEEIPNNRVISQSPGAGKSISTDSSIVITVNHFGDAQFKNIPSLVGKSVEQALDEAKSDGFANVHITISDVNDTSGKVISQFPTPDMTEADVSTIYLTIARLSGNYTINGTIEYTPQISEKGFVVATAAFEIGGRRYEFVLQEGIFENSGAYAEVYPDGVVYKEQVGNLFKDQPYMLTVYLNYKVVYTKYVPSSGG